MRDKHWIDLESATKLTARWRKMNPKAPKAMGFSRAAFERILKQPDCEGIRAYYAQKENGDWTLVLVGTNANGADIAQGEVAEEAEPCPPDCDERSPFGGKTPA